MRSPCCRASRVPADCFVRSWLIISLVTARGRAGCSTSPRLRGEVDLRAERERSDANRVRGLVHKLRLATTPPHPDSFAALGIRPLPARGERWRKRLCLAPQDINSNAIALPHAGRGGAVANLCLAQKHKCPA